MRFALVEHSSPIPLRHRRQAFEIIHASVWSSSHSSHHVASMSAFTTLRSCLTVFLSMVVVWGTTTIGTIWPMTPNPLSSNHFPRPMAAPCA